MLINLENVVVVPQETTLIPAGQYNAYIDTAEVKTTKDGSGTYINTMWKIVDESQKNRTIFHTYMLKSPSAKAMEIGQQNLKHLLMLNNKTSFIINSTEDLLGLKAKINIKTKTDDKYGDKNVITWFNVFDYSNDIMTPTKTYQNGKSSSVLDEIPF